MRDERAHIGERRAAREMSEILDIAWRQWTRKRRVGLKSFDVHPIRDGFSIDLLANLGKDVQPAIIYICPDEQRHPWRQSAAEVAAGRRRVPIKQMAASD